MNRRRLGLTLLACAMVGVGVPSLQGNAAAFAEDETSSCSNIPVSRVVPIEGGGLDYQFDTPDGEVVSSPIPPVAFDVLTATADELDQYGLPPRPTAVTELASWVASTTAMVVSLLADVPTLCWDPSEALLALPTDRVLFTTSAGPVNTTYIASSIWAGENVRPGAGVTYTDVAGKFVQPSRLASCSGARESTWVGLGGSRARSDTSVGLLQAGTAYGPTGAPKAWYEYIGRDANGNMIGVTQQTITDLTVHAGDQMSFRVQYAPATHRATFTATNVTTGVTRVRSLASAGRYYDGRDAEWIVERPSEKVGNTLTPAPLQNFGEVDFTAAKVKNSSGDWVYGGDAHDQIARMLENSDRLVLASGAVFHGTSNGATDVTYDACQ